MAQLTRNLFIPCLDTNRGEGAKDGGSDYTWVPIDLSTQFELTYNPSTDTKQYINSKNDSTILSGYAISLEEEIVLDNTNPMYQFIFSLARELPLGTKAEMPALVIYPDVETGLPTIGDVWQKALVTPNTLNTVDGVLSFTLNLNGDPIPGKVSGAGSDKITFTPDEPVAKVGKAAIGHARVS